MRRLMSICVLTMNLESGHVKIPVGHVLELFLGKQLGVV